MHMQCILGSGLELTTKRKSMKCNKFTSKSLMKVVACTVVALSAISLAKAQDKPDMKPVDPTGTWTWVQQGRGGGGGRGPTIVMNNYGPLAGSYADLGKALTPVLNSLGASGQIRLTAYNALTNGAKQT